MCENVMHHIWAGLQELPHSGPKLRCGGKTHEKIIFLLLEVRATGNLERKFTQDNKDIMSRSKRSLCKLGLGFIAWFQTSESPPTSLNCSAIHWSETKKQSSLIIRLWVLASRGQGCITNLAKGATAPGLQNSRVPVSKPSFNTIISVLCLYVEFLN